MTGITDLKPQRLFRYMDDAELALVAQKIQVERYPKGSAIFPEGGSTRGICLIRKGRVEISKTTPDGWKQTLDSVVAVVAQAVAPISLRVSISTTRSTA